MDTKELFDKLESVGVDIGGSLERFVGNEELYLRFLKKFPEDTNYINLQQAFEEQNYEDMLKYSHALKGLTGNLGLTEMYDTLYMMVSDLRAEEYSRLEQQRQVVNKNHKLICDILADA